MDVRYFGKMSTM